MVSLVEPEVTAATNVNSLPKAIGPPDETGVAPEVMVKVVLVATDAAQIVTTLPKRNAIRTTEMHEKPTRFLKFTPGPQFVLPMLTHFQPISIWNVRIDLDPKPDRKHGPRYMRPGRRRSPRGVTERA